MAGRIKSIAGSYSAAMDYIISLISLDDVSHHHNNVHSDFAHLNGPAPATILSVFWPRLKIGNSQQDVELDGYFSFAPAAE